MEFKKIESLLEDLLNDKTRVIDFFAENQEKTEVSNELFKDVIIENSVFIDSKATIFIALYVKIIKEITNINIDKLKLDGDQLSEEIVDDLIIDLGKFLLSQKDEDDKIIKKYKTHSVSVFDVKNILKWFEVCKNNNLRILII
jgi:hypothetical protein